MLSSPSSSPPAPAANASAAAHSAARASRARTWIAKNPSLRSFLALLIGLGCSGCYLGHVTVGQARLLWARQPIDQVLRDPATPLTLREKLAVVADVRDSASRLGLAVGERYRDYAPWPGDQVVTTVVATRPGEIEAAGFWFPIVGRVPYKGYFDADMADAAATRLREDGLDVCEVPVRAYSTLGWFDDPVTGPMVRQPQEVLVETLLHELVHATVFLPDAADFNEGVASFVGEEARIRYYAESEGPDAARRERQRVREKRRIRDALLGLRRDIEALYATQAEGPERAERREALERGTRRAVAALPLVTLDPVALAEELRLNDACLALTATYAADTPCYDSVLERHGGDLGRFVARLVEVADEDDPRGALLESVPCDDPPAPDDP